VIDVRPLVPDADGVERHLDLRANGTRLGH